MTAQQAFDIAMPLMKEHGLADTGWTFSFTNKKRSAGTCNYTRKTVSLSQFFIVAATEEEVRQTMLHEIAHALTPKQGHNHVWLRKAREIGYTGYRCFEPTQAYKEIVGAAAPYKAVCKNGHEHYAFRMPKKRRSCPQCSSYFNPEFILEYNKVELKKAA